MTHSTMLETTMRRIAFLLPVAGLLVLGSCHSDSNENDIKPVHATVDTPGAVPPGPAAYFRVASSDSPDDDVVPMEVVLVAGGSPITFDAFSIEILPTDPTSNVPRNGIVQMAFDTAAGATPLGVCNSCYATAGCGAVPPATPPACTPCGSCPTTDPATGTVNSPFCLAGPSNSNSFLASAAIFGNSGCGPATLAAGAETVLAVIPMFAQTIGSARLHFIQNAGTGDCEIRLGNAEQVVTFNDRGALFTAAR